MGSLYKGKTANDLMIFTIIPPVIKLILDSRRNFDFNFIQKQTPNLKNAYAYPPNSDEPIVAKRNSQFIGELKIEDCRLNICGGRFAPSVLKWKEFLKSSIFNRQS